MLFLRAKRRGNDFTKESFAALTKAQMARKIGERRGEQRCALFRGPPPIAFWDASHLGAYREPRPQRLAAETGQRVSLQPTYRLLDKHTLKHRLRVSTRKLREVSCAK
jgi:hypothetical protein